MQELIFLVGEAVEGGYNAKALGEAVFTQADTVEELRTNIKEAVECQYENSNCVNNIIQRVFD